MKLPSSRRRALLLVHLMSSLAWMGAVICYLVLAFQGLAGSDDLSTRAAYLGMQRIGWYAIVPLGTASVATGLLQAIGTPWGLFRHYWVLIKLFITVGAMAVLLVHMGPTDDVARIAAKRPLAPADLSAVRLQLLWDACAALAALVLTTALGVYKPRGETPWARKSGATPLGRKRPERWLQAFAVGSAVLIALFAIAHLTGRSPHVH